MMLWFRQVNFLPLRDPIDNYSEQKFIDPLRVQQFLAAALYYDLDIPVVIRFLKGNYTGEYRNTPGTIKALQDSNCDDIIIADVQRTLLTACPNKMTAESTHQNFLKFFRYGNHTSIQQSLDKVMKTLNKEDRNQYLLPFPNWIARFIPNLHLTPQGLLSKTGKNDIFILYESFQPDWESICVNMMLDRTTEPTIVYGDAFDRQLIRIWNLRLTHPNEEICLFDDDKKGSILASQVSSSRGNCLCLPHLQFPHDTIRESLWLLLDKVICYRSLITYPICYTLIYNSTLVFM